MLLRYLIEEALAGRADRLKGFSIAVAVFGRDETFDSQNDPVVRLEARRLRRDLDGYYATAGGSDTIRISVPKGGYAPEFRCRDAGDEAVGPDPAADDGAATDETTTESDATAESATETAEKAARQDRRSLLIRYGKHLLFAILVAVVAGHIFSDYKEHNWADKRATVDSQGQERGPAVIVLPFEALSQREEDFHLAGGLTQQLMTDLMRFEAFRIYAGPEPPANGTPTNGTPTNPVDIASRFPLAYVVKGTVRAEAGVVRVGSQLLDGKSGELLWSENYDSPLTADNLLQVQEKLASEIATRLGQPYGVVRSIAAGQLSRHRPKALSAFQCELGVYAFRHGADRGQLASIEACLEQAVRDDPGSAAAWALLGWLRIDSVLSGAAAGDTATKAIDQAQSEITHAADLAPKDLIVLQASAAVAWYRGDHALSDRLLREALALNPDDPDIMAQLGWRLAARGRWEEGLACLNEAIDRTINPPPWYFTAIALHEYLQGKSAKALTTAGRAKDDGLGIDWSIIVASQAALGNGEAARAALAQMAAASPELAHDPGALLRRNQFVEPTIEALVAGLSSAGWAAPISAGGQQG